ncbi:putative carboxylesterase nap [Pseudovibrio axinellae]|uniref:Putative carboxylesterase nap n=1 Tax=Pseudovibrio axinellae TaxID=989403 RepID=A0A165XZB9_9HYPH|nr:alpha/beta hydrolase [Pseudovibrio axinellae]KZL18265.1 putative carboxylesterase nap [Pseudovibrio axinellae]SER72534.1 Pimeloyl-ACP methyl ester carboxylesterase [Pseudovibrio axinellae]
MIEIPTLLEAHDIRSARLKTRVLFSGPEDGVPVIFIHGNLSAATWFEETMQRLPKTFRAIAPDLRGYGGADPFAVVDATRGTKDFSDDLAALMDELGIDAAHLIGHSLGGGVLWQFLADYPHKVLSLTQVSPASPYGFGCSMADGTPCYEDGAGSGASAINTKFANVLKEKDTEAKGDFAPRNILSNFAWKPPFSPDRMDAILKTVFAQHTGDKAFPGDVLASANWPGAAPGCYGSVNALAPNRQVNPLGFCDVEPLPPILWVHGADDAIVSDHSMLDLGTVGKMGFLPGWPGENIFPPQPMVTQTSDALDLYEEKGGSVERSVIKNCGHSAYLEKPREFDAIFHAFLQKHAIMTEAN